MSTEHAHQFEKFATMHHAPAGEPPLHTSFVVLVCDCGVFETFPEQNFELTTDAFKATLRGMMLMSGYHPRALVDEARALIEQTDGAHDCFEWRTGRETCIVCGRSLAS